MVGANEGPQPEPAEVMPVPVMEAKEGEKNKELLSRERAGIQGALVCDALKPGGGSLQEELKKVKQKIDNGESLDAEKSTNASKKSRFDYWNTDSAEYNNKTIAEQSTLFQEQKDKWIKSADPVLSAFKNDQEQQKLLAKLGFDKDKGADAFYQEFFADHKGDIGYLEGLIGKNFTREDALNAQKKIEFKKIDPKTGNEIMVKGSLLEVLGGFYGVGYAEIKDRAEGVINIKENYPEFETEAVSQFDKGLKPEEVAALDKIHGKSEAWKQQMGKWDQKAKDEEAERERKRQEDEADKKRLEEAALKAKEGVMTLESLKSELEAAKALRADDDPNKPKYIEQDIMDRKIPVGDDPYQKFMERNGYKKGDKIIYHEDKTDKTGIVDEAEDKRLIIKDEKQEVVDLNKVVRGEGGLIKREIIEQPGDTKPAEAEGGGAGEGSEKINEAAKVLGRALNPDEAKIITDGGSAEDVVKFVKEQIKNLIISASQNAVTREQLIQAKTPEESKKGKVILNTLAEVEFALENSSTKGTIQHRPDFVLAKARFERALELNAVAHFTIQLIKEEDDKFSSIISVGIQKFPEECKTDEDKDKFYEVLKNVTVGEGVNT